MSTTEMGSAAITHLFQEQAGEMTRLRPYNSLPGRRITKPLLYMQSGLLRNKWLPRGSRRPQGVQTSIQGSHGQILALLRHGLKVHLGTRRIKHET